MGKKKETVHDGKIKTTRWGQHNKQINNNNKMDEASTGNYPALHTIFIIFEGGNELTIASRKDYGENNTSCRGTYNIEFSTKLNHLA